MATTADTGAEVKCVGGGVERAAVGLAISEGMFQMTRRCVCWSAMKRSSGARASIHWRGCVRNGWPKAILRATFSFLEQERNNRARAHL